MWAVLLMALSFAHGSVQWLSADAAATTYTVSGLSFQPKAIRFYWQGLQSAVDAVSEATTSRRGGGFAVGTADRRCVATSDIDAAGSADCAVGWRSDAIAATVTSAAFDGLLDLTAINSDGFVLTVDDAAPVNITVFWEAWGGSDITVNVVGDFLAPNGITGTFDTTATGLTATDSGDQVVMFFGTATDQLAGTPGNSDSGFCAGFATRSDQAVTVTGNSDDGSATMDTDGYCRSGECVAMIVAGGGNPDLRCSFDSFLANGFRLNALAANDHRVIFLAIKGGSWRAGSYTINGNTGSATATVSGLSFTPVGLSLIGRMTAEDAVGTATANDRIGLGSGSSTSSRRSMGHLSEDGTANAEIDLTIQYDQVLSFPSTAGGLQSAYDINAMNADGFQIIVDTAGGVASEWQGYLTFGNAAAVTPAATIDHILAKRKHIRKRLTRSQQKHYLN